MEKDIQILKAVLTNFKGTQSLTASFNKNTVVKGDNGTGKTTMWDSFTWCLFGKDSTGASDFEVKPLDKHNNVIHKLDVEVEYTLSINGTLTVIKRVLREKWETKRGSTEPAFKGNETVYFVDDVPLSQAEFKTKINAICSEDIFKLITNVSAFNKLPWQERRAVLSCMAGNDITDEAIASGNVDFKPILDALSANKTVEEYKKEVAAKRKKAKDELQQIPVRIDEVQKDMPEEVDFDAVQKEADGVKKQIADIDKKLQGGEVAGSALLDEYKEKNNQLNECRSQMSEIEQSLRTDLNKKKADIENTQYKQNQEVQTLKSNNDRTGKELQTANDAIAKKQAALRELESEWVSENAKQFENGELQPICSQCKRPFTSEELEEQRSDLLTTFNEHKTKKLSNIKAKGDDVSTAIDELRKQVAELQNAINKNDNRAKELQGEITETNKKQAILPTLDQLIGANTEHCRLKSKVEQIEAAVKSSTSAPANTELLSKKTELSNQLKGIEDKLAKKEIIAAKKERVAELERQEKVLAQQVADWEQIENVIQQFSKTKIDLIESRISSLFSMVKFKMYEQQINGGEKECCECLVSGVPYGSGLNNAAMINAGIDIINALSKHYDIYAPIWIDNRESVNRLIDSNSQIINLVVSDDKQLSIN